MSAVPSKSSAPLSRSDLTQEQVKAVRAITGGEKLLVAPVGFGKAVVGQTAVQDAQRDGLGRVIVIAPPKVCGLTWAYEHLKWAHLRAPYLLAGPPREREKILAQVAGDPQAIVVASIGLVKWLADTDYLDMFDGWLIDEISKFKAPGSVNVKKMRKYIGKVGWRVGMSATTVAESGLDVYSQVLLVDGGKALGRNFDSFKMQFFYPTDFNGYNWAFKAGGEKALAKAVAGVVYIAESREYGEQVCKVDEREVKIRWPYGLASKYQEFRRDLVFEAEEGGRDIEAANLAVLAGKLQQMTSGFIYGEDGEAHEIHRLKLDRVRDLVRDLPRAPVIVYTYQWELAQLREMFGDGLAVVADGPEVAIDRWNRAECSALAIHPRSAGHGINLQYGGDTLIFLSQPWSADLCSQTIGRLARRGQKSDQVVVYVLRIKDTIDELIRDRLIDKSRAETRIIEHFRHAVL